MEIGWFTEFKTIVKFLLSKKPGGNFVIILVFWNNYMHYVIFFQFYVNIIFLSTQRTSPFSVAINVVNLLYWFNKLIYWRIRYFSNCYVKLYSQMQSRHGNLLNASTLTLGEYIGETRCFNLHLILITLSLLKTGSVRSL